MKHKSPLSVIASTRGRAAPWRRIRAAYLCWPRLSGWRFAAGQALWLLPLLGACGWAGGFIHWQPAFAAPTWRLLGIAFFFPVMAEETFFRAALIEPRLERSPP